MKSALSILLFACSFGAMAGVTCAVPGDPIHWIADFCMLRMETDDEIAVSACIEQERKARFADTCARKLHFKTRMCDMMIRNGTRSGTRRQCTRDPAFMGATVEAGGVGGRR